MGILLLRRAHHALGKQLGAPRVNQQHQSLLPIGPYGCVRNPMYTVLFLIGIAYRLRFATWLIGVTSSGWITGTVASLSRDDEAALMATFGDLSSGQRCVGQGAFCCLSRRYTMTTFVLPVDAADATLAAVGGKGTNLSRMTRAGFPVPPGFFVTTAAYRAFVQANDLQDRILALASDPATSGADRSAAIRQLFASGTMPPDVAAAIQAAYAHLMRDRQDVFPVAVRSSATAEDLPAASFAGQQESYLNVRGAAAVLDAVKRCWSSLWTPRALEYRARHRIDPSSVVLAVVVQAMVPAEAAGIMFTANPITGARDEIVVDAAWGLGEAIVGGLVTPDHIVTDKATGAIKQMTVADKALMTVPTATGTEDREVAADRRRAHVLTSAQVVELVTLGAAIERYYGAPQDIEWCLADRAFFIVQARPITTLPPEPVRWDSPVPGAKWLKDLQAGEWTTEPLSPLGATTTFTAMITARQRHLPMQHLPWSALVNGWLYIRADFAGLPLAMYGLRLLAQLPTGILDGHKRVQQRWTPRVMLLNALECTDLVKLSDAGLQAHANRVLDAVGWWWWEVTWYTALALLAEQFTSKLEVPGLANAAVLFRGNDSWLLEAERVLRRAARTGEVEDYLARFGHFMESADPIHPTLREAPELFAQYLVMARQSATDPDDRLQRTRLERAAAERGVWALPGPRGLLTRWLMHVGQSNAAHVDDAVFHFQRVLALVRAAFLEAGARLASAGAVEHAADVFYLKRAEVWTAGVDRVERVTRRRQLRNQHKRLAPPPFIPPFSDPTWDRDRMWTLLSAAVGRTALRRGTQEHNGQHILVGTPGSPGRARGPARVMMGPDDFHRFQPGDVLVAHTTTPIWTPLFTIARAAVTEVGGPFSHAAIVAREFGIPLVNGALDATRTITDNALVVVDGSAGIVEL